MNMPRLEVDAKERLDLMSINLRLLSLAGVIPPVSISKSTWKRRIYNMYSVSVLICYLLILMAQFLAMHRFWGDIDVITDNAFTMVGIFMCYVKWAYVSRHESRILDLVQLLKTRIASSVCRKETWPHAKEVVSVADRKARLLTWSLFFIVHGMLASWIVAPLVLRFAHSGMEEDVDQNKPSPYFCFIIWLPFEATRTPMYELVYALQTISFLMASLYYTSINTTIITFIIHTAAQLRILAFALRDMDVLFPTELDCGKSISQNHRNCALQTGVPPKAKRHSNATAASGSEELYKYFVDCIEHHKAMIRFVTEVNELLSPLILFFFFCSQLIMCVVTFQVVLSWGQEKNPLKFVLGLVAASCGPLMFCWYGNHVIEESAAVQEAAYASLWYNRSSNFKRTLSFVIMRSMKPIRVTGIFYDLSLSTYMQMLNAVYTYFAVLKHLHDK